MPRPAGFVTTLTRGLRARGSVPLLAAAITIGAVGGTAAGTETDVLMAGRGKDVHFTVSCEAKLQPRFDAALAALYSFWYGQALKEFTAISEADPQCAMSDWGIAMSLWNQIWAPPRPDNLKKGLAAIEKARSVTQKSQRESDYIEALAAFYSDADKLDHPKRAAAYSARMQQLAARYPDDRNAQIFYALSLLASADPLDKSYANQLKAGGILEPLWAQQPNHPGLAHYIIHSYDYPALAERAKAAAERYASIAPSAAHALHMPSHTFTRVGMWEESIGANLRSIDVATRAGTIGEALHGSDYLEYAYLQMGNDSAAKAVVDGLPALTARFDAIAPIVVAQQSDEIRGHAVHTRERGQLLFRSREQRFRARRVVSTEPRRDAERHDVVHVNPQVHATHVPQALHEQSRGDQQRHR